ncbi:glycosyltransferase family 2 protein [Aliiroseovarius sp. S1339]|uniref:glycosyltransferase family 2 protein n=1 Tax=Aliiroseovarius sp. S1339 TaxID=2936990 RepID=UPI0020C0C4E7|nr:glycosyltransferase family 2 protein [Aliiroseovarius sp. S1339]MCK8465078.1 glycosyltransferase family 2 protein [Aliiroseovarius sp. S1339]
MPKLSIIVVSYNTCAETLACLRSVAKETTISHEVIVVDNASSDGSAKAIAAEFPDHVLMAETENHGFAKANNLAAKHATGEYLLLLNPDTVVLDGAIDKLIGFAERQPDAKIWGGRTYYGDMSLNPSSCWRQFTFWSVFCRTTGLTGIFPRSALFNAEAYGGWDRGTQRQVDIVSGCFFMMKADDWRALDGFDLTFFMYGEEADLCLRARRDLGAAPMVTPDATIIHYGGVSETVRADRQVKVLRAKGELMKRYFPKWQQPFARALFAAYPLSRYLAGAVGARRGAGETHQVWKEVWQRRQEWLNGFAQ